MNELIHRSFRLPTQSMRTMMQSSSSYLTMQQYRCWYNNSSITVEKVTVTFNVLDRNHAGVLENALKNAGRVKEQWLSAEECSSGQCNSYSDTDKSNTAPHSPNHFPPPHWPTQSDPGQGSAPIGRHRSERGCDWSRLDVTGVM